MPSDKQQVSNAVTKYEHLKRSRQFSLPPELGNVAVLHSTYELETNPDGVFAEEAERYESMLQSQGTPVEVVACGTRDDVFDIVRNPQVSSIITIGNGSYSEFWVGRPMTHIKDRLSWRDISKVSTHLKLGYFAHRTCGHFSRKLNIPFATFLMSSHMQIYGAIGEQVSDANPDESKFRRIFNDPMLNNMSSQRLYDFGKRIDSEE